MYSVRFRCVDRRCTVYTCRHAAQYVGSSKHSNIQKVGKWRESMCAGMFSLAVIVASHVD